MDGILYVVNGTYHGLLTLVSVDSLREVWSGGVCIASCNIDKSLTDILVQHYGVINQPFETLSSPNWHRKSIDQTRSIELSPFEKTVLLDCDTIVCKQLDRVFPTTSDGEVVLTEVLFGKPPEPHDRYLKSVMPRMARHYRDRRYWPIIHTAVMGFSKSSVAFFREWRKLTGKRPISIDKACRTFYFKHPHIVLDDRYNASPERCNANTTMSPLSVDDVVIWHCHGKKRFETIVAEHFWWPRFNRLLKMYPELAHIANTIGITCDE